MRLQPLALLMISALLLMSGCTPPPERQTEISSPQQQLPTPLPVDTATPRPPVTIAADTANQMTALLVRGTSIAVEAYERALGEFHQQHGRYPSDEEGLSVLNQLAAAGKGSLDAWKQPFRYRTQSLHGRQIPDVWSAGPDGQDNTNDDIGNWMLNGQ